MKNVFLFLLFLSAASFGFATIPAPSDCTCADASGLTVTGKSSGSITYIWADASGATEYEVYYVRQADGHTSAVQSTTATSHTFSGLQAGTHTFYVRTVCGAEKAADIGIVDVVEL